MPRITESEAGCRNMLAFLDMLAWSEIGERLLAASDDGYNVIVGGAQFKGYADHPRRLVDLPKLGIKSSAAGRYQLLQRYWDAYRVQLGLKGFSPENQDRIAIQQIRERRAISDIQAGRIQTAIEKVKNIWASLPGAGYGQHEQKMTNLLAAYAKAGGAMKQG